MKEMILAIIDFCLEIAKPVLVIVLTHIAEKKLNKFHFKKHEKYSKK